MSTLVEELEQAANDAEVMADYFDSPSAGRREKGAAEMRARAVAYRSRIEHIKRVHGSAATAASRCCSEDEAALDAINLLLRDLP